MRDELRDHLERQTAANIAAGMSADEAKRQARLQLGAVEGVKEGCREERRGFWLDMLWADACYASRLLRKNPGFTAVAIITLALGIGANTAIFSVIYGVLLRPLPYPQADRIGKIWIHFSPQNLPHGPLSVADYFDWRARNHAFEDPAAYTNSFFDLTGINAPEQVPGARVTSGFFSVMGVRPILGRTFLPYEDSGTSAKLCVLGQSLWKSEFGASKSVIGQVIELDGEKTTVIGVMPESFRFPNEGTVLWTNLRLAPPTRRAPFYLTGLGRLRPGVTWQQAQTETNAIGHSLEELTHGAYQNASMPVLPIREALVGDVRLPLFVILGTVIAVLLIASANVANLLLARSTTRQNEIALRAALGATPERLVRQLLTESFMLAVGGAAVGVAIAWFGIEALRRWNPGFLPRIGEVHLNAPVLMFTVAIAMAVGVIFGVAPACASARMDPLRSLGESPRIAGGYGRRARSALVIAEIALSFVLLVGGGLLLRSFGRLENTSTGIHTPPEDVLTMLVSPSPVRYKAAASQTLLFDRILEEVKKLPGVNSAAFSDCRPPTYWANSDTFHILDQPWAQEAFPSSPLPTVSPEYFRVLGIPLVRGRYLDDRDVQGAPQVAVISRALARRYFPNQDPIGHLIAPSAPEMKSPPYRIVGVVGDVKYSSLQSKPELVWYSALAQGPGLPMFLLVRSPRPADALKPEVESAVRSVDKDAIIASELTLADVIGDSVAQPRFRTALLALFAALALVLAAVGTYGVIAYSVAQRTREIGVRIALGAQRGTVLSMILREGTALGLAGIALGIIGALIASRILSSVLFQTSESDALTFCAVTVLLVTTTLLACWIPAWRAMRVDPMVSLRYE
jgi:putative ABC transport system permease protein